MQRIRNHELGHASAIVLVVAILVLIGLAGWQVAKHHHKVKQNTPTASVSSNSGQTSSTTTGSAATDNSSLNADLNGINGSMNQENSDSNTTNNALNDQQSQIAVPTN